MARATKQRPPVYPRPVSRIYADERPPPPQDVAQSLNRAGSHARRHEHESKVHTHTEADVRAAKRRRIEANAEAYLRGEPLYIMSAHLKGPFDTSWKNPWAKKATPQPTRAKSGRKIEESPQNAVTRSRGVLPVVDTKQAVQEARKRYIALKSASQEDSSTLGLQADGAVLCTSPLAEEENSVFKDVYKSVSKLNGQAKETRVEAWLRTNEAYIDNVDDRMQASPTPRMRTPEKGLLTSNGHKSSHPGSNNGNYEDARMLKLTPQSMVRQRGEWSGSPADRIGDAQELPHARNAPDRRSDQRPRPATTFPHPAGVRQENTSVSPVDEFTTVRTIKGPLASSPQSRKRPLFVYDQAYAEEVLDGPTRTNTPADLQNKLESGGGGSFAFSELQQGAVSATGRSTATDDRQQTTVKPKMRSESLLLNEKIVRESLEEVPSRKSAIHRYHDPSATDKSSLIQPSHMSQSEAASGVGSSSVPKLSAAVSDVNTIDLLPSAQRPAELLPTLSSGLREEPLLDLDVPLTKVDRLATSQSDFDVRLSLSGENSNSVMSFGMARVDSNSADHQPIDIVPDSAPVTFGTARRSHNASADLSKTITVTKEKNNCRRNKKASFAIDSQASITSLGSIKNVMNAKVSKKLGSPSTSFASKSKMDSWYPEDAEATLCGERPKLAGELTSSIKVPRSILKSTNTASSRGLSVHDIGHSTSRQQDQSTSAVSAGNGQNVALDDERFDLDAAIEDLGSFLGTWDAEKEASGLLN